MSMDQQDVTVYLGDDSILTVAVTNESGQALDVTGASFAWLIAQYAGMPALVSKSTASGGISVTAPTTGQVQITVTHADTSSLGAGVFWHQLVMTDSSGDVSTVMTGTFTVTLRT